VPFFLVGDELRDVELKEGGGLKDVAPTVLKLLGLPKPDGMEGEPLF
jgi:2,3-bisphosphoglycerate-independent phosphoglycerate mutase